MDYNLENLYKISNSKTKRFSSYDRTGGNKDWIEIESNQTTNLCNPIGPGIIRHMWFTIATEEINYLRDIVLRIFWDDEETPSVEVPIGDFHGVGFGINKQFYSAPVQMAPEDGRALNCYFPMPFKQQARIEISNYTAKEIMFYYNITLDTNVEFDSEVGYFHAKYNRFAKPDYDNDDTHLSCDVKGEGKYPWFPNKWNHTNTNGADNYVVLDAIGKGHYVGCVLNIDNFKTQKNHWYGEGDEMIFIDGDVWPPTLHGTGTEDYFNTAFCPTTEFNTPDYGISVYSGNNSNRKWSGKNSMYRFHIKDPIFFDKDIKVTFEKGHANLLGNDYSSVAYWYQTEPHTDFGKIDTDSRKPRE